MLTCTAVESSTVYVFTVTGDPDGTVYTYEWSKTQPEGQTKTEYLQSCKREALLLAQNEIDRKAPPTELVI